MDEPNDAERYALNVHDRTDPYAIFRANYDRTRKDSVVCSAAAAAADRSIAYRQAEEMLAKRWVRTQVFDRLTRSISLFDLDFSRGRPS